MTPMPTHAAVRDARNPRLPSDLGLPTLGLLMQLLAGVTSAYGALLGFMVLVNQGYGTLRLAIVGIVIAGWVRAVFHTTAARRVIERSPEMLRAVRNYLIAAGVTTALTLVLLVALGGSEIPPLLLVAIVLLSGAWPVTLGLLVFRPRVRAMFATADGFDIDMRAPDRSIEGTGVLMTAFGGIGLGIGLLIFYMLGTKAGPLLFSVAGLLVFGLVVVLIVRSSIHLAGGIRASTGVAPDAFRKIVDRYHLWAVISVVMLAVVMLVLLVTAGGGGVLQLLFIGVIMSVLLLVWPMALSRFAGGLVFDGDTWDLPVSTMGGAAPDRGLTAFGYLLLVFGSAHASVVLVQLVLSMLSGSGFLGMSLGGGGAWDRISSIIVVGATLWAGVELVSMSRRYRVAMVTYGIASLALAVIGLATGDLGRVGSKLDQSAPVLLMAQAVALVTPIMALVLSRRRLPAS